jgi:NADH:ubiquinone oxidoreductase subunit E
MRMSVHTVTRLTRAQAEGREYELPDDERSKAFEKLIRRLRGESDELLEALHGAQECYGCLPEAVLGWIAREFKIPENEVYEAATFYSMFSLTPASRYVIGSCDCLPCYLNGGEAVFEAIRKAVHIPEGETSSRDGLFSVCRVSCLGLCDLAPVIMINRERYGLLTPEKAHHIIAELVKKETRKGSRHDRKSGL